MVYNIDVLGAIFAIIDNFDTVAYLDNLKKIHFDIFHTFYNFNNFGNALGSQKIPGSQNILRSCFLQYYKC